MRFQVKGFCKPLSLSQTNHFYGAYLRLTLQFPGLEAWTYVRRTKGLCGHQLEEIQDRHTRMAHSSLFSPKKNISWQSRTYINSQKIQFAKKGKMFYTLPFLQSTAAPVQDQFQRNQSLSKVSFLSCEIKKVCAKARWGNRRHHGRD